jgi:formamidopyrimidine-DNA glycosylase
MPEGHVVHLDARRFTEAMAGRVVRASSPQGRFAAGAAVLDGRVLSDAEAYGKHLFLRFSGDGGADGADGAGGADGAADARWLHVHLGLIGGWTWWDAGRVQTAGRPLVTAGDAGVRLRLVGTDGVSAELRGATVCDIVDEHAMDAVVAALGPDPIRDDADASRALARIRGSRTPIGTLLLDQSVVAGAGLIWRCEAPFLAGVSPHRPGRDLSEQELAMLWRELRRIMRAAVDRGLEASDRRPALNESFHLFRRGGEPCRRCSTPIRAAKLGGRAVWWCPRDQPR